MHSLLVHYLLLWKPLGYILTGLGVAIDGEPFLFAAAYLAYTGFLNAWLVITIIFVMTIIGDIGWYYVGSKIDSLPKVVRFWAEGLARPFDPEIINHPFRIFLWSKFAYGIHHALWARTGSLKIPIWKYILIDTYATILWMFVLGGLTYIFGAFFDTLIVYVKYVEVGLLLGLIIFVYAQHKIGGYVTEKLKQGVEK